MPFPIMKAEGLIYQASLNDVRELVLNGVSPSYLAINSKLFCNLIFSICLAQL